jgi:hypothetical protein
MKVGLGAMLVGAMLAGLASGVGAQPKQGGLVAMPWSAAPPPGIERDATPPSGQCALSVEDLAAGKRAYCGYMIRYTTFHDNEMDRFLAQMMNQRDISMDCAKQAVDAASKAYTADPFAIPRDCYGYDVEKIIQTSAVPKCLKEAMMWSTRQNIIGQTPHPEDINRVQHDCEARGQ